MKILSQTGISLADVYDVEGSIAGVEELESERVHVVHDMGPTIFSERYSGQVVRVATAALAQNLNFDVAITDLPLTPIRLHGVAVLIDAAVARVLRAAVLLTDPVNSREMPVWVFDGTNSTNIRIRDGGAVANVDLLDPDPIWNRAPSMLTGIGQPQRVSDINFRGTTAGFGAGTITLTMIAYISFAALGGVSSLGLPLPGW